MNEENNTPETQTGGHAIASESSVVTGTVSNEAAMAVTLKEINEHLGKNYKDKESALKSLKDTFSYVGKKMDAQPSGAAVPHNDNGEVAKQLREMKTELFYSKHPEYEPYKAVIGRMGENPSDVVGSSEFKEVFEKASGFDKIQKTKTVLESNPRIGQIRNKQKEAHEALANREYTKAADIATENVIDALNLGK